MSEISGAVTGLTASTAYQYRLCIRNEDGGGLCGAPGTFTTKPDDRDVVQGSLGIPIVPELGYVEGVAVSVRAEPDGSQPVGQVSRSPGSAYFRVPDTGPATCPRIVGNRAAIGFVASFTDLDPTVPDIPQVVFVEDNGPTGDRFASVTVDETPTACPDPSSVTLKAAVTGDVTITDHP
jgi:hypothetical protein